MAGTISISNEKSDIWMVKNTIYAEFISLVSDNVTDSKLVEDLESSVYINGIALDEINRLHVKEIIIALKGVAHQICSGKLRLLSFDNLEYEKCRSTFCDLLSLLKKLEKRLT